MNCKPGELAMLVNADGNAHVEPFLGRIVRVTAVLMNRYREPSWEYEGEQFYIATAGHHLECIPDVMLRPLRDPGDDARDETLDWLTVPNKETA